MLFFLITLETRAQQQPGSNEIQLSLRVVERRYCKDSEERENVELRLRLNYRNVSKRTILLPKYLFTTGMRVTDGKTEEFDLNNIEQLFFPETFFPESPGDAVVALEPNQAVGMFEKINIAVGKYEHFPFAIGPGKHRLELTVSPIWPLQKARAARERWQAWGSLSFDRIVSQPMEFDVESNRQPAPCGY